MSENMCVGCDSDGENYPAIEVAPVLRGLDHAAFAALRFFPDKLSEIPDCVARWRVAPGVRFNACAIFARGSLPAIDLRARKSSFDHARFTGAFFAFDIAFAISIFLLCLLFCDRARVRRNGSQYCPTIRADDSLQTPSSRQDPAHTRSFDD
jgi:hypothetical protein